MAAFPASGLILEPDAALFGEVPQLADERGAIHDPSYRAKMREWQGECYAELCRVVTAASRRVGASVARCPPNRACRCASGVAGRGAGRAGAA